MCINNSITFWVEYSRLLLLLHVYSLHAYICPIIAIIIIIAEAHFWVVQSALCSAGIPLLFHLLLLYHSVCAITEPSANLFAYYCNGSLSFLQQEKYGREKEKENPAIYFLRSAPIYMSNFIGGNKSGRVNNNNKFIRNEICTFTSTSTSIGLT